MYDNVTNEKKIRKKLSSEIFKRPPESHHGLPEKYFVITMAISQTAALNNSGGRFIISGKSF